MGVVFACGFPASNMCQAETVFPGAAWQRVTPESQRVDAAKLKTAVDYMDQEFGPDGAKELVIVRNGYLIWEGPRADAYHPIWSCTLDTRAVEWETHLADQDPLYSRIRLRHLASMCGGYQGEVKGVREDQPWGDPMAFLNPRKPLFEAGTTVQYNDHDVFLLGKILTQMAREPLCDVFQRRIAGPIGMTRWEWGVSGTVDGISLNNPPGNPGGAGAGGVKTTARELARFGLLYLNRGNWNGRQLLSASLVGQATTNQVPLGGKYRNHDFRGRYGFYWWVNGVMATGQRPWPSAPPNTYTAHGKGCNFCFVIPEWNMVVVRMGTVPVSTGNIAKGDRLCDEFFRLLAGAVEVSGRKGNH
jgi:CubicO group peptidase (beta-lactamase class C family)